MYRGLFSSLVSATLSSRNFLEFSAAVLFVFVAIAGWLVDTSFPSLSDVDFVFLLILFLFSSLTYVFCVLCFGSNIFCFLTSYFRVVLFLSDFFLHFFWGGVGKREGHLFSVQR